MVCACVCACACACVCVCVCTLMHVANGACGVHAGARVCSAVCVTGIGRVRMGVCIRCVHVCLHAGERTFLLVCVDLYSMCVCVCAFVCMYVRVCVCMCRPMCMGVYVFVCVQIRTHTNCIPLYSLVKCISSAAAQKRRVHAYCTLCTHTMYYVYSAALANRLTL